MKIMRHEGSPRQSSFGISGTVFYKLCSQVLMSAALRIEQPVAACSRLRIPHKFGTDRRRQDLQGAARNGQSQPRAIRSSAQRTDAVERVTVIYFYFNSQNRLVETFHFFFLCSRSFVLALERTAPASSCGWVARSGSRGFSQRPLRRHAVVFLHAFCVANFWFCISLLSGPLIVSSFKV